MTTNMGVSANDGTEKPSNNTTSMLTQQHLQVDQRSSPNPQNDPSEKTLSHEQPADVAPDEDVDEDAVRVGRRDPKKIISFGPTDLDNPYNWPRRKKIFVLITGIMSVVNSTLSSSLPSGAIKFIARDFHVTEEIQLPLPISCFLAGYVVGPCVCGPLSEHIGRKLVMLSFFFLATVFTLACSVAPNWPSLLFFRFVCGIGASGPIATVGGLYADIYNNPHERGFAMAWFMVATTTGPVFAPGISGFIAENTSWRWVFGVGTLFAAATAPLIIFMPETFQPVLLHKKAKRLRKQTGDPEIIAKTDLQKKDLRHILVVVMLRPFRMLFQEVIVMCVCAYLSLAYGIFYMYFEAYPIIFQGPDSVYKWSPGLAGLAFLPIVIGSSIAYFIFAWWDSYLTKAQKRGATWSRKEEYRRLPLACLGGPLYVVSLFWIGWSAKPGMFWLAPVSSGVTFGMAFLLVFMALLNYLSDAYENFAASAQGIASTCRSCFGVLLPLASSRMFRTLGIPWACSLLAFLSMGMSVIPFVFIRYGDKIRANSRFCQQLKELKAAEAAEREREEQSSMDDNSRPGIETEGANNPTARKGHETTCAEV